MSGSRQLSRRNRLTCLAGAALLVAAASTASAQTRIKVGDELAYQAATPRLYPQGGAERPVVWSETVHSPGATFLRLHFSKFNLPDGDFLTVRGFEGKELWTYTGAGPKGDGEFWSFVVESDLAVIELHAGPQADDVRGSDYGLTIDRIAHGTVSFDDLNAAEEIDTKSICGTDGRENVACYTSVNNRPVAQLTFQSGGSSFVCTGWLVAGPTASTMLTNNHCFDTQSEVNTVQARFNYQRTTCTGTTTASTTTYTGGTFRQTNTSLDYTIFTVAGNPEATWGEYTATTKTPTASLNIYVIQHPGGGLKTITYWKDSAKTLRCNVTAGNQTVSGYTSSSQVTYSCDTEGGASGSPVMDAGTGRIIGLHHLGDNPSTSGCLNAGTQMKNVCSAAGSLLSCATN